jgi:hypothetical protein
MFSCLRHLRSLSNIRFLVPVYRLNRIGVLVNQDNQELIRLMAGMSIFS